MLVLSPLCGMATSRESLGILQDTRKPFRAHRVGWRLCFPNCFNRFFCIGYYGSKPTVWDGDMSRRAWSLTTSLNAPSPPCGMATIKSGIDPHLPYGAVLSPPCGMVTCDTSLRYCALYHCSKPTVWDGDREYLYGPSHIVFLLSSKPTAWDSVGK